MAKRELRSALERAILAERDRPERLLELSIAQKNWLERAWMAKFGFVPEAIPRYNEQRGFFYVPAVELNWHHIRGLSVSVLYDGVDPHRPENIVPLSARWHTGKGMHAVEEGEEEFVIHPSALEAFLQYSRFKIEGGEDPFMVMKREGMDLAAVGMTRHFDLWDEHFRRLAEEVTRFYQSLAPNDDWPRTKWERK